MSWFKEIIKGNDANKSLAIIAEQFFKPQQYKNAETAMAAQTEEIIKQTRSLENINDEQFNEILWKLFFLSKYAEQLANEDLKDTDLKHQRGNIYIFLYHLYSRLGHLKICAQLSIKTKAVDTDSFCHPDYKKAEKSIKDNLEEKYQSHQKNQADYIKELQKLDSRLSDNLQKFNFLINKSYKEYPPLFVFDQKHNKHFLVTEIEKLQNEIKNAIYIANTSSDGLTSSDIKKITKYTGQLQEAQQLTESAISSSNKNSNKSLIKKIADWLDKTFAKLFLISRNKKKETKSEPLKTNAVILRNPKNTAKKEHEIATNEEVTDVSAPERLLPITQVKPNYSGSKLTLFGSKIRPAEDLKPEDRASLSCKAF